ncbi:unnamed protein product [Heterosigma akashiwo]
MSAAIPEKLNYKAMTPMDLGSHQETGIAVPINGTSFSAGEEIIIHVPRSGSNAVFDPANSYLRFKYTNSDGTNNAVLCGSCDSFISRVEVRHGSAVLETISNYEVLSSMLLDSLVNPADRAHALNLSKGCNATQGNMTGVQVDSESSKWFSTQLISGVVGTLCKSYIPTYALSGNIEIRITLNSATKHAAGTTLTGFTLTSVQFHANFVHLNDKIISAITPSDGTIELHTETFANYQNTLTSGATVVEQVVPSKVVSLKSLLVALRLQSVTTTASMHTTSRGAFNITDYAFRIGSKQMPASRVYCYGYDFVEPLEELKKAFHVEGTTLGLGCHDATSYVIQNATNATGSFMIGLDTESYSGKSGEIMAGLDTTGSDVYFSANFPSGGVSDAALIDVFAFYDVILRIEDGQMVAHF